MARRKTAILVVEDEPAMSKMIRRNLELAGYKVYAAPDATTAMDVLEEERLDLVVLDLLLPDGDGLKVCQEIRESYSIPIIIVTALGAEEDKIRGFDAGADDYVTKPFAAPELLARVKAVLRRSQWPTSPSPPQVFRCGDTIVDFAARTAQVGGREEMLTPLEFRILGYLVANAGRVISHEELLTRVWGPEYKDEPHLVRVNVGRLRQKIEITPSQPLCILTRPGLGYMMVRPTSEAPEKHR